MALVIAGERSGSGKTTITLALLSVLAARQTTQSFKVGPDYIDPMFHQFVTHRPCYNLDPNLTSESYIQTSFKNHAQTAVYNVVEGVMGLFDGAVDPPGYGSTAHIAKLLNLPVLLVIDCRSLSHSIAAIVQGYRNLDPHLTFAGVILNRVGSDRHLELLQTALTPLSIDILGVFRREDSISLPDRHLGLVPTAELPELSQRIKRFAELGKRCFHWETLEPLLKNHPSYLNHDLVRAPLTAVAEPEISALNSPQSADLEPNHCHASTFRTPRIAVAQDQAFSFYYAANLELLKTLGAELVFWSPLQDETLPNNIQGLYFGGGFPEVFAAQLSANSALRQRIRQVINQGMPTYAECGGLMYLCEAITDFQNITHPMVGVLPTKAVMGNRLTLGYRTAIALHETPLLSKGVIIQGHEFHRSSLTIQPADPLFQFTDRSIVSSQNLLNQNADADFASSNFSSKITEGWHFQNLHASYLHLHWGEFSDLPRQWLDKCRSK